LNVLWKAITVFLPEGTGDGADFRKRVEWLILLRLLVTVLLLGATVFFQLQETGSLFFQTVVPLYILIGATFLLSLIYTLSLSVIPNLWAFSFVQIMIDVLYATVLVYFTGGSSSVFTLMYLFPIFSSGILHFRRGAMITACASAVLFGMLITLQFHELIPRSEWQWVSPWSSQTAGYVLWVLIVHFTFFFVVAIVASSVAEQLKRTRISLNLREIDYRRLAVLHGRIVDSIPSGIVTTDEQEVISFVNASGAHLLGMPLPDLMRKPLSQVFPFIDNGLSTQKIHHWTYVAARGGPDQQMKLELTVTHLKGPDGTPSGRLLIFQDVTQIKKMEEQVKLSEKQAAFVRIAAGMAHEIRNPLASLRAATELLSHGAADPHNKKRLLDIVIRESDRLNALLGDFLLAVSSRQTEKERMMLSDLVEKTVELFSRQIGARSDFTLETIINKGLAIEGQPAQLKQALWNLLMNAADAVAGGGLIRVTLEADSAAGEAILKVQDSGPGIPPEIRDRIFEPFTTTKEKGTGLGLSLVLSALEAHNGIIEVETAPGAGTVFAIRLPLMTGESSSEKGGGEDG